MEELKYPVGSIISWCDDYFKVIKNSSDYSGTVVDTANETSKLYFEFAGESAILIKDEDKIRQVEGLIQKAKTKDSLN